MLNLILFGLLLVLVQSFIPAAYKLQSNNPATLLGPQDTLVWSTQGDRSLRAMRNLHETLPIFLTLGILCIVLKIEGGVAAWGGIVYLVARVLYIPLFIIGVSSLRSASYHVSLVGLGMMVFTVMQAGAAIN